MQPTALHILPCCFQKFFARFHRRLKVKVKSFLLFYSRRKEGVFVKTRTSGTYKSKDVRLQGGLLRELRLQGVKAVCSEPKQEFSVSVNQAPVCAGVFCIHPIYPPPANRLLLPPPANRLLLHPRIAVPIKHGGPGSVFCKSYLLWFLLPYEVSRPYTASYISVCITSYQIAIHWSVLHHKLCRFSLKYDGLRRTGTLTTHCHTTTYNWAQARVPECQWHPGPSEAENGGPLKLRTGAP